MNKDEQNKQNEEPPLPADRGIPSVASSQPKGRLILMAGFLGLALLAMVFVIIDGMNEAAPASLVKPEKVSFRTKGGAGAPYIKTEFKAPTRQELKTPKPPKQNYDPAALQREMALQEEALRIAQEQQKTMEKRLHSPQLIYDQPRQKPINRGNIYGTDETAMLAGGRNNDDTAFTNAQAGQDGQTVKARQLKNLSTLVPQGTIIAGILETAIQSDLPGMIRAIISENVYSFDSTLLLIPKGARLIGRYRSGVVRGQSRVFVIWERLIRNDGVSININSPGTDVLGRAGLGGDINSHFLERFGSSVLLSLIDTGLQIGSQSLDNDSTATVALNTGNNFSKSAEIALENSIAIAPTIHVNQGKRIKVFVGQDLDFSDVTDNTARYGTY